MKRRTFLQAAGTLISAMALPDWEIPEQDPPWMAKFKRYGVLENETIILKKTLVLKHEHGPIKILGCKFEAAKGFVGDSIICIESDYTIIQNNDFDCTNVSMVSAIKVNFDNAWIGSLKAYSDNKEISYHVAPSPSKRSFM